MQKKWWQEAVVYQIYCKSFCDSDGDGIGDIRGIISKLPNLKELGINCIWLNPVYCSPQVDNGYDISDYYDIEPTYGTMADFKELLETAHGMGIRVIMDLVLNHTSDQHKWFQESRKSKDNPYRNYYIWRKPKENGKEPNNWGNYFFEGKGSAWEFDETPGEYYLHNYSKHMPDTNWEYEPLRQEMYRMMRWWLDLGVDGFRLDAINRLKKPEGLPDSTRPPMPPVGIHGYVVDRFICTNVPGIHELIQDINKNVWSHYDCMTVGEMGNTTADVAVDYIAQGHKEIDMLFHFEIGKNANLITVLDYKTTQARWAKLLDRNAWLTQYLTNHDTARQVSRFGNDREYRVPSAKLLATLTHTMPGTPFVYQGEEIGMANVEFDSIEDYNERYIVGKYWTMVEAGEDPEVALASLRPTSRDNARTPYQWNNSENAGFTSGKPWIKVNPRYTEINYEADRKSPDSVFAYYQKLIAMRKENPAILDGDLEFILKDHPQLVIYTRKCARQKLLVIANFSNDEVSQPLPEDITGRKWERLLANYETDPTVQTQKWLPWQAEVYELSE